MYAGRKFGPRRGSVARDLGAQIRDKWHVFTGSLSAQPEPRKTTENPHFSVLAPLSHTVTLASSFPRSYSHGHDHACTNHYYACVLCVYVCEMWCTTAATTIFSGVPGSLSAKTSPVRTMHFSSKSP